MTSRRRFLLDLVFIGGALLLAAGATQPPAPAAVPVWDAHHPGSGALWGGLERP